VDKQEFLDDLHQLNEDFKKYFEVKDSFTADLSLKLCDYANKRYPQLLENAEALSQIKEKSEVLSLKAFDYLINASDKEDDIFAQKTTSYIPKITTRSESEIELQDFLNDIPIALHESATRIHWIEYEDVIKQQKLDKEAHDLVKSVLVKHFEEEIMEFNSSEFHYIDNITWSFVTELFLEEVYASLR